jgi:hypothetical protein
MRRRDVSRRLLVGLASLALLAGCGAGTGPTPATGKWQTFTGDGYQIDVPADWRITSPDDRDDQLVSPTQYPFVEIQNLGKWPDMYGPAELAGIYDFSEGSGDVVRSNMTIDGESAVLVRFHHTSEDTGIVYYRLPAFVLHRGIGYKIELIARAGGEVSADALLPRLLTSFQFND